MVNSPCAEYLVAHGKSGGFGRFAADQPMTCARGERVVVRSARGLELGAVLCNATSRHIRLLGETPVGELLRRATPDDEACGARLGTLGQSLFDDGRRLVAEMALSVEVLDVEVLLDGRQAVIQHLSPEHCDLEPFVETLARRHNLEILLENLALPAAAEALEAEAHGGCGKPDCGRASDGGCSSCGTGGGCSSCGSGKVDMRAYFSHLRSKMEEQRRTPLV